MHAHSIPFRVLAALQYLNQCGTDDGSRSVLANRRNVLRRSYAETGAYR